MVVVLLLQQRRRLRSCVVRTAFASKLLSRPKVTSLHLFHLPNDLWRLKAIDVCSWRDRKAGDGTEECQRTDGCIQQERWATNGNEFSMLSTCLRSTVVLLKCHVFLYFDAFCVRFQVRPSSVKRLSTSSRRQQQPPANCSSPEWPWLKCTTSTWRSRTNWCPRRKRTSDSDSVSNPSWRYNIVMTSHRYL